MGIGITIAHYSGTSGDIDYNDVVNSHRQRGCLDLKREGGLRERQGEREGKW